MSTQVTLNISNIQNNNVPCKDPIILVIGHEGEMAFPCTEKVDKNGNLKVSIPDDLFTNKCIKFVVKCSECDQCKETEFEACLCETGADCPNCSQCVEGICVTKCSEGEFCKDNTCVECDENNPCPKGFICINGTCVCLGKINEKGDCVQCLGDGDCSQCESCQDNQCVEKVCPNNLTCISGDCSCPPGTKYDVITNSCIPVGCDNDSQCGECETCVAGNCQPIVCPEGYICQGGECIYWPCTNTSCGNSADCGPECTCIEVDGVKQCVPCYTLTCDGQCAEALGCKCNTNTDKCEPIDNCGDYCDGFTPCLDPGCTCYDNKCVSCENFPCDPNDCSSRQNCGCVDGDCTGGQGCKDKLEIVKDCGVNKSDCKLTAKLTLDKGCKCDDIRFETDKNTSCDNTSNKINLKVKLFKGLVDYSNFADLSIGDNEFVEGIISTKVTHYDVDGNILNLAVTPIPDQSIVGNKVGIIEINKNTNYKISYNTTNVIKGTRVKIEVIAKNVKIPNNDCINYNNETVIASYELDFRHIGTIAGSIGNFTNEQVCFAIDSTINLQKAFLNDRVSVKRPLFIWSKSATDFPNTAYINNANYSSKGWFRKQYATKSSTGWEDVLSTVEQGLVNNYNYVVKADCGCAKTAVHNSLDFCCLADVVPTLSNCNSKAVVPSFRVCEINGVLGNTTISDFNKAYYKVTFSHSDKSIETIDVKFNLDGVTTLPVTYEAIGKGRITLIRIERYFKGGLLENVPCFKDISVPVVNIPEIVYNTECTESAYKVTLNQVQGSPKILGATFTKQSTVTGAETSYAQSIVMGNSAQKTIDITIRKNGSGFIDFSESKLYMLVSFEGGCVEKYILDSCKPSISVTSIPDIYSGKNCDSLSGPTIEVSVVGLTSNVQYSLNNGAYQSQNTFEDLFPGTYNIKAKDIINGVEVILEDSITIESKMEVQVSFNPSSVCAGESASLVIGAGPSQSFTIKAPNGTTLIANAITNAQGVYTYPNLTVAGEYTVISNTVSPMYCSANKKVSLVSGGEVLNPSITFQAGSYCVGQPIPFRVFDDGKNRSYNLLTTNGSIASPLQATDTGFNGEYIPSSVNGSIIIQSSTSTCDTMAQVTVSTPTAGVTIANGATIGTPSVNCVSGLHTVTVNVVGATAVTIGGVVITPSGTTYTRTGITGVSTVDIVATNGSCSTTTPVVLQNCDCPTYEASIAISEATCGQGAQTISFNSSSSNLVGVNYQLQEFDPNLGYWYNVGGESGIFALPAPSFTVNNQISNPRSYRVLFDDGICTHETNLVTTSAISVPVVSITSSSTNVVATGVPFTLTANVSNLSPGATASYLWSGTGVSGATTQSVTTNITTAGVYTYSVAVSVGTCTAIVNTFEVTVNQLCNLTVNIANTTSCSNPTATAQGGSGAYNYAWSINGGPAISTLATLPSSLITPIGTPVVLTVTVTDANSCIATASINYTRCGGEIVLDLATTGPWSDNPTNFYAFLTDIRAAGSPSSYWSGSGNVSGNGSEEYMLYHNTADTGCPSDLDVVQTWFGTPRVLVPNIVALAASLQTEFNSRGLSHVEVVGAGSTLTFKNLGCTTTSVTATVYYGNTDGSCGITAVNKLGQGFDGTIYSNQIVC
jgi:hypothetical protein